MILGVINVLVVLKNVAMLALLFDLEVDFNIFILMILIFKSMLSNKLDF